MLACDHLTDRFNAAEWFVGRHASSGRGDRIAIVTDEGKTTFRELDNLARSFAAALERQGVHPGDRVAIVLPDGPLFSMCFWGAIAHGAVAVPLNTLLKPEKLKAILADCDPRLLVFDARAADGPSIANEGCAAWESAETKSRVTETPPAAGYAATHRDAFAFFLYSSENDGRAQGRRPPPARSLDLLPDLWRAGPVHAPRGSLLLNREALLRLWARQRAVLSL